MKNLITLSLGLLTCTAALAADPAPVKVHGKLEVMTSNGNRAEFLVGRDAFDQNDSRPDVKRFNTDRYDQNSCAVKIAKLVQDWEKNGIRDSELRSAIDHYNAQIDDVWSPVDVIEIKAKFSHKTHGMAEDGSRRLPTRNSLRFFDLVVNYGVTNDIQTDASTNYAMEESELCDENMKPELVIKRLAHNIKIAADGMVRDRELRRQKEVRERNRERLRDAELGDAVLPSIDAR